MGDNHVVPVEAHNALVAEAYRKRGFSDAEAEQAACFSAMAAWHGIKTHNAIKALHLDELFGSRTGGCVPGAEITRKDTPFMIATTFHDVFTKDAVRTNVAAATPLRREGEAGEVADLVAYLASEESSFITGASYDINGGLAFS